MCNGSMRTPGVGELGLELGRRGLEGAALLTQGRRLGPTQGRLGARGLGGPARGLGLLVQPVPLLGHLED